MEIGVPTLIFRIIRSRPEWVAIGSSLALAATLWMLALFTFPQDTPAAILHYSVGVGIDIIGEGRRILVLPIIASVLLGFNAILARYLKVMSIESFWVLVGTMPLIQIILLAAYIILWRLN